MAMRAFSPEAVRVVSIEPLGRASSVFFQGLLEGHPALLTLPLGVVDYAALPAEGDAESIAGMLWGRLQRVIVEFAPDRAGHVDPLVFQSAATGYLDYFGVSRRSTFVALHYAYAIAAERDPLAVRCICSHTHSFDNAMALLSDFRDVRVIFVVRDPRASFGSMKKRADLNPAFQHYRFTSLYTHFYKGLLAAGSGRAAIVRHEDIHTAFEPTIQGVAGFLDVSVHPCMQESTFFGSAYTAAGRFTSTIGLHSSRPDPRYANDEWTRVVSPRELRFIERTAALLMQECSYAPGARVTGTDFDYMRYFLTTSRAPHKQAALRAMSAVPPLGRMAVGAFNRLAGLRDERYVRAECGRVLARFDAGHRDEADGDPR